VIAMRTAGGCTYVVPAPAGLPMVEYWAERHGHAGGRSDHDDDGSWCHSEVWCDGI
jgi:hypothetical protein